MEFHIRDAAVRDWPQVAGLLVELGRDVSPSATTNPSYSILFGGHLAAHETRTLVAESGDRLIGFLDLEFRQRLGHPRPQAWVNDLVVSEPARSMGVGNARGCFRMSLETAAWRERAHAFYRREGWLDYGRWFVKVLDERWVPRQGPPGTDGD
jgi:GNAT superfamily N-acetyltransferase